MLKEIKKLLATVLLLASLLVMPVPSSALGNVVTLSFGNLNARVGDVIQIPILISKPSMAISSYGIEVNFDKEALQLLGVNNPHGSTGQDCDQSKKGCFVSGFDQNSGYVRAAWVDPKAGDNPIKEALTLFTLEFKVIGAKNNPTLEIDTASKETFNFTDNQGNSLPVEWKKGKLSIQEKAPSIPSDDNFPSTTPNENGSNPATPSTPNRQGDVGVGNDNNSQIKFDIIRQKENDRKIDNVVLENKTTEDAVKKALQLKQDNVNIRITDIPSDLADEVGVKITKQSIGQLSSSNIGLTLQTDDVSIQLPKDSVQRLKGKEDDLYFRVVPIRKEAEKKQVFENTLKAKVIKDVAGKKQVQTLGKPMTIETNYQNQKAFVTFSLKDIELPTDPAKQKDFLKTLAVFIQHSDGDKVIQRGNIKYDAKGKPVGIEIEITKFSTFTLVGIPNIAPKASNVKVTGDTTVGKTLKASYTYSDFDKDKEGTSTYQWYRSDTINGKNKKAISGATKSTYKLSTIDKGKYISLYVTPIAKTGERSGITVKKIVGPIKSANTAPIATNLKITGKPIIKNTLKASFKYKDIDGDKQGKSTIKWYRIDKKTKRKTVIAGATNTNYKLTSKDYNKYIIFEIKPYAKTGVKTGKTFTSSKTPLIKYKK